MAELLYILLGWFLGLASHLVLRADDNRKYKKEFNAAIVTELQELQFRLAGAVYLVAVRRGEANRSLLEWLKPIQEQHAQIRPNEVFLEHINALLKASDEELRLLSQRDHEKEGSRGLTLKKYELPFIESQIGQLSKFNPLVRQAILHVKWRLSLVNEEIDETREWFRLTYAPSLSAGDRAAVNLNLENGYAQVGQQSRLLVELIKKTLILFR